MKHDCTFKVDNPRKIARDVVIIYDSNRKPIPYEKIERIVGNLNHIEIYLKDSTSDLDVEELMMLMEVLRDKVEYGTYIDKTRKYIEIHDKIEKKIEEINENQ